MAKDFDLGKALVIPAGLSAELASIDKKIEDIATHASDTRNTFNSAMDSMTASAGGLLGVLTQVSNITKNLGSQDLKSIERFVKRMLKVTTSSEKTANSVTHVATAVSTLTAAANAAASAAASASASFEKVSSARNSQKAIEAYNRAMMSSEATMSQRINKMAKMRHVIEMLQNAEGDHTAKIQKLRDEMKRLEEANKKVESSYNNVHKSQSHLMDISGQLARKLALVFSISQVRGYLMNVMHITGEFEKQSTALASILQSQDKADIIFGKVKGLALKSPYNLKELVTYTKSLSAYQVEYEKLYDTTKMLADVSSGLGVDMQRLILAFGQVKAANYLRGTEVRQFTEAGFNMLGELAKYYSELEGKMISVGDVQERVTKRMVAFGDVEEVFKRVTSAGGMFYEMQERQSETIAGQWSNLQDSLDIMMNDIGTANKSVIKDFIAALRGMIENWEAIAKVAKPILTILIGAITYTKVLIPLWKGLNKAFLAASAGLKQMYMSLRAATRAQDGFNKATAANAWLAVGALVVGIIYEVKNALEDAKKEEEELNKIAAEGFWNANTMAADFKKLAEASLDASKGYAEQKKALDELRREFGEILPRQMMEIDTLREMKGNYDDVTNAINNYMRTKTQEKQIEHLSSEEGANIVEEQNKLAKSLQRIIEKSYDVEVPIYKINNFLSEVRKRYEEGSIKNIEEFNKTLNEVFSEGFGKNINVSFVKEESVAVFWKTLKDGSKDFFDALAEYKQKYEEIMNGSYVDFASAINQDMQTILDARKLDIKEAMYYLDTISEQSTIGEKNSLVSQSMVDEAKKNFKEIVKAWGIEVGNMDDITRGSYAFFNMKRMIEQKALSNLADTLPSKMGSYPNGKGSVEKFVENLKSMSSKFDTNDLQKIVEGIISSSEELNNISFDKFNTILAGSSENMENYVKRINGVKKELVSEIIEVQKYISIPVSNTQKNREELSELESKLKVVEAILAALPKFTKDASKGRGSNKELEKLREKIRLLKEAKSAYDDYIKYFTKDVALQKVKDDFAGTSVEGIVADMSFDTQGVIDGIKSIVNTAGKDGEKAINDAVRPLEKKRDIEIVIKDKDRIKQEIDDIFASFDLTKTLDESGADIAHLRDMLKSVGASSEDIELFGLNMDSLDKTIDAAQAKINELNMIGGEENIKMAEEVQKKITALELEEAKKRLSEIHNLEEKFKTNDDKIYDLSVEIEKMNDRIFMSTDETEKELLRLRIRNNEIMIEELKRNGIETTDFWQRLFGDLDELSFRSVRKIAEQRDEVLENAEEATNAKGNKIFKSSYTDTKGNKKEVQLTIAQFNQLIKSKKNLDRAFDKSPVTKFFITLKKGKEKGESTTDFMKRLTSDFEAAGDAAFDTAGDIMGMFNASDDAMEKLADAQKIFHGAMDMGKGIGRMASGDILGGAMQSIKGISSIVQTIGAMGDKKKEKQIKRELELVEKLEKAYDKLKEAVDNAYSIDTLESSNEKAEAALRQENEALQRAIRAEDDKKKTDHDRIKEWEEQIEDNIKRIKELQEERIAALGGLGSEANFKSAAEEFADAWYEAFKQTNDGLSGLEDNFADMFDNIIKKQILLRASETFLKGFFEQIDSIFAEDSAGGGIATREELDNIKNQADVLFPQLNEYLKSLMEQLGVVGGVEKDTMTGLQKGIASISEDTAQVLAAITESIRFFTADSNAQLHLILNELTLPNPKNPFLSELKLQTAQLKAMNSLWNSLTTTKAGVQGKILKMVMM